jgi:hypothetical protein
VTARAVAPAVGKALEAGIVVLFVAGLTAALYGGVVPDARNDAGGEVGERALQHAAREIAAAVPATGARSASRSVSLPDAIHGEGYRVTAVNGSLVLAHDHPAVGGRTPLVLPSRVREVRGALPAGGGVVRVRPHPDGGLVVVLAEGET